MACSDVTPRPVQPTLALFPRIFPIVRAVTRISVRDAEVMEAVWNLLKQSVSTLKDDVRGHVHDILDLIMCSYPVVPHGGALELTHPLLTLVACQEPMIPLPPDPTHFLTNLGFILHVYTS